MTRSDLIESLTWFGNHVVFALLTTLIVGIVGGTLFATICCYYLWDTIAEYNHLLTLLGLLIAWIANSCVLGMLGTEVWNKLEAWAKEQPDAKIISIKTKTVDIKKGQLSEVTNGQLAVSD